MENTFDEHGKWTVQSLKQLAAITQVDLENSIALLWKGCPDMLIDNTPRERYGGEKAKVTDIAMHHRIISATISGYALFLNSFNCIFPALIWGGDPRSGGRGHSPAAAFEARAPTSLSLSPPLCVALNCKLF